MPQQKNYTIGLIINQIHLFKLEIKQFLDWYKFYYNITVLNPILEILFLTKKYNNPDNINKIIEYDSFKK